MGYVPGEGVQINRFAVAVGPIHGDRRRRMIFVNHLVDNEVPFAVVAAMAREGFGADSAGRLGGRGRYVGLGLCDGVRAVLGCNRRGRKWKENGKKGYEAHKQ